MYYVKVCISIEQKKKKKKKNPQTVFGDLINYVNLLIRKDFCIPIFPFKTKSDN